jgi:thioredoxin 1
MTNNDKVPELSNGEFENFTKQGFVLVDFFADWCMPCLMMAPIMEELSEKLKGKVRFGKINIDDNHELNFE